MSGTFVHLNGRLVPAEQAAISVFDAGLLHGASVFTTMLAHRGVVFRLDRHLARLMDAARLLGLRIDATAEGLAAASREVLAANGLTRARMRITLTPGGPAQAGSTTIVTAEDLPDLPQTWYEKGVTVTVTSYKQAQGDPTYGAKTGCYLTRVLARQEAAAKGAEEALWYTPDHRLAEACFCNVFLVLGGTVRTPPCDTPVLPGIVRQAVLELCGTLGVPCEESQPLTVWEMLAAEEMFLTSSLSGVRPVVRVERHAVGTEKPGPVTGRILSAYQELLDRECGA